MKNTVFLMLMLLIGRVGKAQTIAANPGWNISVPANTIAEAGTNYAVNMTSGISQTLIDFNMAGAGILGTTYTVSVQKIDSDWNSNLSLWTQRTGNGSGGGFFGTGTITGGSTFMQLTNAPQVFFSGSTGILATGRTGIPIQYEIRGLSVLIPVKTYTTTVVFTITN